MSLLHVPVKIHVGDPLAWRVWGKEVSDYAIRLLPACLELAKEKGMDNDALWWPLEVQPSGYRIESPTVTFASGEAFTGQQFSFVRYSADLQLLLLGHITAGGSELTDMLAPDGGSESRDLILALPLYREAVDGVIDGYLIYGTDEDSISAPVQVPVETYVSEATWSRIVKLFLK